MKHKIDTEKISAFRSKSSRAHFNHLFDAVFGKGKWLAINKGPGWIEVVFEGSMSVTELMTIEKWTPGSVTITIRNFKDDCFDDLSRGWL